jgi:hypothetical protein
MSKSKDRVKEELQKERGELEAIKKKALRATEETERIALYFLHLVKRDLMELRYYMERGSAYSFQTYTSEGISRMTWRTPRVALVHLAEIEKGLGIPDYPHKTKIPELTLEGEGGGKSFKASVIAEISPIEERDELGRLRIIDIGLDFDGEARDPSDWPSPHEWTAEDREVFWVALFENLDEYIASIKEAEHYFPSPTSMAYVTPVFSLGLQKEVEPEDIQEEFHITMTYLSIDKPQSTTQIQLKLFESLPEERLREIQRSFKDNLSPYGLKCLYLVLEECAKNRRQPWFVLDTNACLDVMGYKRNRKRVHQPRNKTRLLQELNALTRINFNIERRIPKQKRGKIEKDSVIKFKAPLLSMTANFEEWEVDKGRPVEEGTKIREGIEIFIHPQIYKYVGEGWYTIIPKSFLTIDARSKPHAILLYSYIANQWRIGWHQYQGVIKQNMRQILDGSGLRNRLPKRRNQQRDFIERIKEDLGWLKDQEEFWIKSVRFQSKDLPILEQMVTITMAEEHPLKTSMTRQIETAKGQV